ncbi:kinase-like domain-containing protein [Rhizophagus irregularis DAOM 181602=DAOM 197198]|uniref:Kinase-like domain-containing protein n=1 Tax=Rhizophagus irregularis (strain DAOM 181602 / DAOM 197198 / MUCL 43194) TaxID=747089 RepID=A0A2P4QRA8_RHIID|nr:kinase-like domain-containing protein [Rhizophagus irregularis DAOM 181602=DAOM 197198]POG80186.1 kinase-like domain-containing protein [Rhizophagus irregularis DAOM 181602=DAOM 197198]|eukprot:XP_025187052.1 kinase-like domain-containing protein [Rhizophagus irregularis DAOM 181602=DAOM 197198]
MELLKKIFKKKPRNTSMEILNKSFKEKPRNLWKYVDWDKYHTHATVSSIDSTTKSDDIDDRIIYMDEIEKRKEIFGICGECNEPGTGGYWCQPCNAKRFKENFKNWTSGNEDVDELIQHSQLNAIHHKTCLEWIPFEKFQSITYITRGGFGKIYSAKWPEGRIGYWDIEHRKWIRATNYEVALKSLDNSSEISTDFLNEDIVFCYGITQDPNTKDYMMVLNYCKYGNLRNYYLNNSNDCMKPCHLSRIANGLLSIHNAEKVHKDFHSGNILFSGSMFISDLGMCQPANNKEKPDKKEGVYGVLPYMAPEVLLIPFNDIPHDHILAVKICKGLRPKISEGIPKLFVDLIMKCWDAKAENRPTAKELYQVLKKWDKEGGINSEIYFQMNEYEKIRKHKLESKSSENMSESKKSHPQAIYTSRLLNFKNLPEPLNSSDLSLFQLNSDDVPSVSANPKLYFNEIFMKGSNEQKKLGNILF